MLCCCRAALLFEMQTNGCWAQTCSTPGSVLGPNAIAHAENYEYAMVAKSGKTALWTECEPQLYYHQPASQSSVWEEVYKGTITVEYMGLYYQSTDIKA